MRNMDINERNEFDRKVAEACADPRLLLRDMATLLKANLSAVARSLRRQNISRPINGKPATGSTTVVKVG